MSELAAPRRIGRAPIWRRLLQWSMEPPNWNYRFRDGAFDGNLSEESRAAHIQAAVDALFAPPHPDEFRRTYVRFWGDGSEQICFPRWRGAGARLRLQPGIDDRCAINCTGRAREHSGRYRQDADPTATAQKAIAQTSADRTDYRFPLAVYQPLSAKNVDVTVHFKPVSGEVDQAGGIAVRLTDRDNYYIARANALEDNVRFYRVVNGRRLQIQGANLRVASNQWHTLGLRAEGNRFTVSFDASRSTPPKTIPSRMAARSRCGPRPTA